jgi:hypothetical protein
MNLKDMLAKMSQLSEATEKTKTGVRHTAEPGGYGRKDDEDEEGNKVKSASTEKKGRGRPKKAAAASGEDKKYDFSAFGVKHGKDIKLPAHDKKKTTKHSIKEYFDQIDASREKMYEAEQIQIKPAAQMPKKPGQTSMPGQQQQVAGQPAQNTQVIAQGNKTLGTVNNPQLANQIKQSIGKGEMTLMPDQQVNELDAGTVARYQDKAFDKYMGGDEKRAQGLDRASKKQAGAFGHVPTTQKVNEKDIGKHNNATTGFDAMVRKLTPKYGIEAAKRIAGSQMKKIKEADMPTDQNDMGAGLGAGRSQGVLEGRAKADNKAEKAGKKVTKDLEYDMKHKGKDDAKAEKAGKKVTKDIEYDEKNKKSVKEAAKPDYIDLDKDGDKKETMKKAASDKKKKVKEGMEQSLQAARLTGKSHGLKGHSHCGKNYEDMEEARMYHEGYKEGLDECYGQMGPAVVGEVDIFEMPPATVGGMADAAVGEGNAFTAALARTPKGDKFSVGGKTFTDRTNYDSRAFESLETQLNALLEGKVDEGMTVSISKGQQGSPDSVSVTAQDGEADQLLQAIKQAGLGLFGGDDGQQGQSSAMSLQPADGGQEGGEMGIDVVDDHDGMMDLIRKITGDTPAPSTQGFGGEEGSDDYEDEEGSDEDQDQKVDEVESYDQEEEEVAEDNPPDSGAAETTADENAEAAEDQALATAMSEGGDGGEASEEPEEVNEWANDAGEKARDFDDESFKTDMDFMTKVISGGLNKQKSTGQSTVPVVATQMSRLGNPMQESVDLLHDWKKLSGIK